MKDSHPVLYGREVFLAHRAALPCSDDPCACLSRHGVTLCLLWLTFSRQEYTAQNGVCMLSDAEKARYSIVSMIHCCLISPSDFVRWTGKKDIRRTAFGQRKGHIRCLRGLTLLRTKEMIHLSSRQMQMQILESYQLWEFLGKAEGLTVHLRSNRILLYQLDVWSPAAIAKPLVLAASLSVPVTFS